MWPRGAPGAAVVGELGWCPLSVEVRRLQFSLFSRLSAAGGTDDGRTLASRVFNYAVRSPGSWAHDVKLLLQSTGSPLPADFGVMPGAQAAQLQWRRSVARPLLHCQALAQYRSEVVAMPSLRPFLEYQPHLACASHVHGGRLAPHLVREWTLARCGHLGGAHVTARLVVHSKSVFVAIQPGVSCMGYGIARFLTSNVTPGCGM